MPTAVPSPIPTVIATSAKPLETLEGAMLARLVALNASDPTLAALLLQWQQAVGKPYGT